MRAQNYLRRACHQHEFIAPLVGGFRSLPIALVRFADAAASSSDHSEKDIT
jgi:hypothetical protein